MQRHKFVNIVNRGWSCAVRNCTNEDKVPNGTFA